MSAFSVSYFLKLYLKADAQCIQNSYIMYLESWTLDTYAAPLQTVGLEDVDSEVLSYPHMCKGLVSWDFQKYSGTKTQGTSCVKEKGLCEPTLLRPLSFSETEDISPLFIPIVLSPLFLANKWLWITGSHIPSLGLINLGES